MKHAAYFVYQLSRNHKLRFFFKMTGEARPQLPHMTSRHCLVLHVHIQSLAKTAMFASYVPRNTFSA